MMVLDAMDLQASHIVHSKLYQHNRAKASEAHGRGGCSRGPFIAGDVLVMSVERQADCRWITAYTSNPTTVSMAQAAIRSGCSSHTGAIAAGFLLQRKPGSTVTCCS